MGNLSFYKMEWAPFSRQSWLYREMAGNGWVGRNKDRIYVITPDS